MGGGSATVFPASEKKINASPLRLGDVSLTRIVIGADAPALTAYAASELRKYLALALGRDFPVARGAPASGDLFIAEAKDGFAPGKFDRTRVEGSGGCLKLLGENPVSALYAVYDFLQAFFDIRFFAPGAEYEYVPRREEMRLAEGVLFEGGSAFEIRDFVNRSNNPEALSFAVKNRVNTILGCGPWRDGSDQCSAANAALIQSFGLRVRGPGHSWKHFVPDASLLDQHPEYFSLLGGQRVANGRTACFSNPETRRIFRENLRAYLREHAYWDIFAFWAEDLPDYRYCECPECAKMKTTDWYMTLVNEAAEVVAQELPHARFELIVYQGTAEPPEKIRTLYQNGQNMLVNICLGQTRDMFHPFAERMYGSDAVFAIYENWRRYLRDAGYAGKIMLMEYYNLCEYPNYGPRGRSLLWPLEVIREDIHFYKKDGLDGLGAFTGFDKLCFPSPFRLWAWLRLWTDPDVSLDALEEDFHEKFFGAEGDAIRRYTAKLVGLLHEPVSEENVTRLEALGETLRDVRGERVGAVRLHFRYAMLLKRIFLAWEQDDRERCEALKTEYTAFQDDNAAELSKLLAPFPMLWYHFLLRTVGWDREGRKIQPRPGTEGMLH